MNGEPIGITHDRVNHTINEYYLNGYGNVIVKVVDEYDFKQRHN
jgi:hypothetical protein